MGGTDAFLDTNVLLYLLSGEAAKADRAEGLLAGGGTVSVQVLNEFAAVARRKLAMPAQHMESDEIGELPQAVQHRQRQTREKLEGMTHTNAPAWKRAQGSNRVCA